MELFVYFCILAVIISQGVDAKSCQTDNDCASLSVGATKRCVDRVCSCLAAYTASANGCQLFLTAPILEGKKQVPQGGNLYLTCKSSVTLNDVSGTVLYTFMKDSKNIRTTENNMYQVLNVDQSKAGRYACKQSVGSQWGPASTELTVFVVEPGRQCNRNQDCPDNNGYVRFCETDINRCKCDSGYVRRVDKCAVDGAPASLSASIALVLLSLVLSRTYM